MHLITISLQFSPSFQIISSRINNVYFLTLGWCEMKQSEKRYIWRKRIQSFWGIAILTFGIISSSQSISVYADADISMESTETAVTDAAVSDEGASLTAPTGQDYAESVITTEGNSAVSSESDGGETFSPEPDTQETAAPSDSSPDLTIVPDAGQMTDMVSNAPSVAQEQRETSDSDDLNREEEEENSADSGKDDPGQVVKLRIPDSLPSLRTISVQVSWKPDEIEKKPESITCTVFSDQSEAPVVTYSLSEADASETDDGTIVWSKTLPDHFPVYSKEGSIITYRIDAVDSDRQKYTVSVQENQNLYQNLNFYVPSESIKEGDDYLLADSVKGTVSLYKSLSSGGGKPEKISAGVLTGDGYSVRDQEGNSFQSFLVIQGSTLGTDDSTYVSALNQVTWSAQKDAAGNDSLINCASNENLPYPLQDSHFILFHKITPLEMPVENATSEFSLTREDDDPQNTENHSKEIESEDIFAESQTENVTENQTESISEEGNSGKARMFSIRAMRRLKSTDSSAGKRTITIKKTWEGENGDTSKRPDSLEFILYTDNPSQPLKTVSLTKANATNSTTWEYTLPEQYPIYDSSGNMIEYHMIENMSDSDMTYYRMSDSSSSSTLQTGYSGVSVFVPVSEIEDGTDYLVTDGNDGAVSLFRAEAPQTDGVLTTAAGTVNVLSDRILTGEDGTAYSRYILIKDTYYKTLGGEQVNDTDFMTWRAHAHNNGTVLTSNAYRLWGLEDSGDENRYSGFLTFSGNKWKITKSDSSTAGADSLFFYDASTGGFRTENGQTLYLFKKVSVQDDLSDQAETKFMFTNYRHSDVMDIDSDPAPISDSMDVKVEKQWADQEDHSGATVTIALLANGKEVRRIQLDASMDWKGTFDNLPEVDEAGNEISYGLKEISAVGNDGKPLDYQMAQADASEAAVTEEKIWLPVSRPGKTSNGEEYVVICWPNNVNGGGSSLTDDGSGNSAIIRTALTANSSGTQYALGEKNAGNVGGTGNLGITLQTTPITVGGKTYSSYIKDEDVTNTHKWKIAYAGQGVIPENGSYIRDLFTFQSVISGNYVSTQGSMPLNEKAGPREKFAYGFPLGDSGWPQSKHLEKQGYTKDQVAHMICAMDHYTIRTNQSPGGFNDEHYGNTGLYLYKAVTHTTKSFVLVNRKKEKTSITVKKKWDGDSESIRPESVLMELYRNGQATGNRITLDKTSGWEGSFEGLDILDSMGVAYRYTVVEVSKTAGYTTEYGVVSKDDRGVRTESWT
jgi:hypothetical protein